MRLILMRNIERLGTVGDIVEVSDGYARNCLLPKELAIQATQENIKQLEHKKRKLLAQEKENYQKFKALGAEIVKQSVTIRARANEEDHLFGSVGAKDIADAFEAEGISVEPRTVLLEDPIRELGRYTVRIRLHPDVEVAAKVWVVAEDSANVAVAEDLLVKEADASEEQDAENPDAQPAEAESGDSDTAAADD